MASRFTARLRILLSILALSLGLTSLAAASPAAASDMITPWQLQTPVSASIWDGIAYGNGVFVAVSNRTPLTTGTTRIMTSPDGINWSPGTPAVTDKDLRAVAFGNGRFVAVGKTGVAMTSVDGTTWFPATGLDSSKNYYAATYGNGRFVAVGGTGGAIAWSVDGSTWTPVSPEPTSYNLRGVAFGNGTFVAVASKVGSGKQIVTSSDGEHWTAHDAPEFNSWFAVAFGGGQFVAVATDGANRVMTSTDGTVWTQRATPTAQWLSVAYGGGVWVAVAGDSVSSGGASMTSRDGITWASVTPANTNSWRDVTYGAGLFVAVSENGTVMTSTPLPPSDPQGLQVRQALPLGTDGTCSGLDDAAYSYGTGLTGGWQRGWEPWPNAGQGGWACIRALVNSYGTWRIDNSAA